MGSHERRFLEKSTSPPVKGDSRNGTQLFWVPPSHCDKVHQGLGYQVSSTKPVPQLFFPQGMALFTSKPTEGRIWNPVQQEVWKEICLNCFLWSVLPLHPFPSPSLNRLFRGVLLHSNELWWNEMKCCWMELHKCLVIFCYNHLVRFMVCVICLSSLLVEQHAPWWLGRKGREMQVHVSWSK